MANQQTPSSGESQRLTSIVLAWAAMLLIALAPIVWIELLSAVPAWWDWVVLGGLLTLLALTFAWTTVKPLRGYLVILLVMVVVGQLSSWLRGSAFWTSWTGTSWALGESAYQVQRLVQALLMMLALVLMGRGRRDFYLVKGQLDAPAEPVRLLRIKSGEPWTQHGRNFAVIISAVTLAVLAATFGLPAGALGRLLSLFPVVLLVATMNAFSEEFMYRAAWLSELGPAIGAQQGLWITTVAFGLAHFYGTPSRIAGVLLAGFLGWFLGKSMLETRGFTWAWFIHFLQDVVIFSFVAMGA